MNNTPAEIQAIIDATEQAKTKWHKKQKEWEKKCFPVYLKDNKNTIILTKKGNDPEKIKRKYKDIINY